MENVKSSKIGLTREQASIKLKLSNPLSTGYGKYQYLKEIRKQRQLFMFKDFLCWYNKTACGSIFGGCGKYDWLPTLQKNWKVRARLYNIKLRQNFPTRTCRCKTFNNQMGKRRSIGKISRRFWCPSVVFTWKIVPNDAFLPKKANCWKSIICKNASQLNCVLLS